MIKRLRLNSLRKLRSMRDRILSTDNEGIAAKLLFQFPNVITVSQQYGGFQAACVFTEMRDGHEARTYRTRRLEALKDAAVKVYRRESKLARKVA